LTASLKTLAILAVLAAGFVIATSAGLPAVVASHFAGGGQADGFMTGTGYVVFMLAMMAGLATLFGGLPWLLRRLPTSLINMPNRDYWLAPERKAASLDELDGRLRWFACALLVFMSYVHYLVVQANEARPPMLPEREFILGLVAFGVVAIAWMAALMIRFRRPPAHR
jgi:hypothetical protein